MSRQEKNAPAERGFGPDWRVRRASRDGRLWFLIYALERGLLWALPFAVGALLWAWWYEVGLDDRVPALLLVLALLVLLGYLLWGAIFPTHWLVSIGPREVMVERGVYRRTRVFMAYDRVQQVDRVSTPIMERLGLTGLVLHSAAGGVRIYVLEPDDSELIQQRVRREEATVTKTLQ